MPKSKIDYDALERMSDAELKHFIAEYSRGDEDALHCIFMLEEAIAAGEQRAEAFRDRCNAIARKQNKDFAHALEAGDPKAVALWTEVQAHYAEGNMTPGEREFILTQTSPEESDIEDFLQFVLGGPDMVRDLLETLTPMKVKKVLPGRELNPQEEEALRYTDRERAALRSGSDEEKAEARKARRERSRRFLSGLTVEDFAEIAKDYAKEKERQKKKAAAELPQATGRLAEFWAGKRDFVIIPQPRGIDSLLSINTTKPKQIKTNTTIIDIKGRIGYDEQKIMDALRFSFTDKNPYRAQSNFKTYLEIPLTQTMEYLGRPTNDNNKKAFTRKLVNEILPNIRNAHFEYKDKYKQFKFYVGAGSLGVDRKRDKIYFQISDGYAAYLSTGALSQYSRKTLLLGNRQNPLPYYLARKMQSHYFHDGNRQLRTNNILSISKLLEFSKDILPNYEDIQEDDPGHWVRRIKERIEDALNDIQKIGLFKWEYCKEGMNPVTKKETTTRNYNEWRDLYITFALIPEEPDQAERLEHKRQRIEDAKAAKAVKDAEAIIEADRIQKRNARKNGQKKAEANA